VDEENGGEPDPGQQPTNIIADPRSAQIPAETNYAGGRS
jgi:hypothetical protein